MGGGGVGMEVPGSSESDNAGSLYSWGQLRAVTQELKVGGLGWEGCVGKKGPRGSLRVGRGRIGGCWGAGEAVPPSEKTT